MQSKSWLLPEGVEEMLPQQAAVLEQMRRRLLDMYQSWGYQLIMPPFIEYLDSLLTGTGRDLDLQTFKLTDQLSGRQLGVRADMTPQAARIDAHQLRHEAPTRLCYLGNVLRTRPDGYSGSRSPFQIGAELFGHSGVESDAEVLALMIETLRVSGLDEIYLDLGHVGVFRSLAAHAGLDQQQESALFEALQRKAKPEIAALVEGFGIDGENAAMLNALADLNGGVETLATARETLAAAPAAALEAIDYLAQLGEQFAAAVPGVPVHYDLAELRAYHYQTGVVFAAFVPGRGNEVARGGRYDHIGEKFGRARPATGFSADLKTLIAHSQNLPEEAGQGAVLAPAGLEASLEQKIRELRSAGRTVIRELPGQAGAPAEMGITEKLENSNQGWVLTPLS